MFIITQPVTKKKVLDVSTQYYVHTKNSQGYASTFYTVQEVSLIFLQNEYISSENCLDGQNPKGKARKNTFLKSEEFKVK